MINPGAMRIILAVPPNNHFEILKSQLASNGFRVDSVSLAFRIISAVRREKTDLLIFHPEIFKGQEKSISITLKSVSQRFGVPVAICYKLIDKENISKDVMEFISGEFNETFSSIASANIARKIIRQNAEGNHMVVTDDKKVSGFKKADTVFKFSSDKIEKYQIFDNNILLHKIIQLVYDRTGIAIKHDNLRFKNTTLSFMKRNSLDDLRGLYELIITNSIKLTDYINELTINETYFFRNRTHFGALSEEIFPRISKEKGAVKIWSAACSTGEEPYSIAMVANDFFTPGLARIRASDIDSSSLEYAQKGIYSEARIKRTRQRFRPFINRYFNEQDGESKLDDSIRLMVDFHHESILNTNANNFDLIFCRNVMIYFDQDSIKRMVKKFEEALVPKGILIIGHSESLRGYTTKLKYSRLNNCGVYILE